MPIRVSVANNRQHSGFDFENEAHAESFSMVNSINHLVEGLDSLIKSNYLMIAKNFYSFSDYALRSRKFGKKSRSLSQQSEMITKACE